MDRISVDPFFDPLDRLSYESIYEAFRNVGSETQRLEFKQDLNPEELARQAVAMANGSGGIIIAGFKDPVEGQELVPVAFPDPVDEPARRGLLSRIQSRVYPSLPIDCGGYTSTDGSFRLLLLRVERSEAAPHELINDRGRFIVRRGTEISGMTLRELENLIRHPGSGAHDLESARAPRHGMIAFDRSGQESFVGATLFPETDAYDEPLSRSRQYAIERIVRDIESLNAASPETYPEGILFAVSANPPEGAVVLDDFALRRWARRAYVSSNGRAEIRRPLHSANYEGAIVATLCDIYALGSQLLLALGLGPRATGSIIYHGVATKAGEPLELRTGDFRYDVNFSTDSVADMARRPLMFALRAAGTLTDPGYIDPLVSERWRYSYSAKIKDDLRLRWQ